MYISGLQRSDHLITEAQAYITRLPLASNTLLLFRNSTPPWPVEYTDTDFIDCTGTALKNVSLIAQLDMN